MLHCLEIAQEVNDKNPFSPWYLVLLKSSSLVVHIVSYMCFASMLISLVNLCCDKGM